jgi:hypothetical protein
MAIVLAVAACQSPAGTPAGSQSMDPNMPGMSMDASASPTMDPNMPGMSMDASASPAAP